MGCAHLPLWRSGWPGGKVSIMDIAKRQAVFKAQAQEQKRLREERIANEKRAEERWKLLDTALARTVSKSRRKTKNSQRATNAAEDAKWLKKYEDAGEPQIKACAAAEGEERSTMSKRLARARKARESKKRKA